MRAKKEFHMILKNMKFKSDLKIYVAKIIGFFNLETLVPDKLWGQKGSTSFLRGKDLILCISNEGHIIMSKKFRHIG